ncbi:hypothetical protein RRG08_039159 [Elysia crispata]|uniref:Uncharacterized protein n=1 Tax=Elysia crispata TaxID=231223 RepID=A0AAE0ZDM3_9GAST|nr:hypothetical protein RRG08_039159 [Elysia crispata]
MGQEDLRLTEEQANEICALKLTRFNGNQDLCGFDGICIFMKWICSNFQIYKDMQQVHALSLTEVLNWRLLQKSRTNDQDW